MVKVLSSEFFGQYNTVCSLVHKKIITYRRTFAPGFFTFLNKTKQNCPYFFVSIVNDITCFN